MPVWWWDCFEMETGFLLFPSLSLLLFGSVVFRVEAFLKQQHPFDDAVVMVKILLILKDDEAKANENISRRARSWRSHIYSSKQHRFLVIIQMRFPRRDDISCLLSVAVAKHMSSERGITTSLLQFCRRFSQPSPWMGSMIWYEEYEMRYFSGRRKKWSRYEFELKILLVDFSS